MWDITFSHQSALFFPGTLHYAVNCPFYSFIHRMTKILVQNQPNNCLKCELIIGSELVQLNTIPAIFTLAAKVVGQILLFNYNGVTVHWVFYNLYKMNHIFNFVMKVGLSLNVTTICL